MSGTGIIFDCDGTLLDSMGVWRSLEDDLASLAGISLSQNDRDRITAMTIPEVASCFHEEMGLYSSVDEVHDHIDEFMYDYYANKSVERPGALAFVRGLSGYGIPMAVASSTPPLLLKAGLKRCGFEPYLASVWSVDDVGGVSKRRPDVYDAARKSLGTSVEDTWGFEDCIYAIRTLKKAGYRACGIYDCDASGTFEELSAEADLVFDGFTSVSAANFLINSASHL